MRVGGEGACWCGERTLAPFSEEYRLCERCGSLVWRPGEPRDPPVVRDESTDFYGLNYFVEHARALGHPELFERTRTDLSERCVFWLKALLRHRPPPARTLELGCGNGAFVATLAAAGYDATGLDLSPALAEYVRKTFDVPMLTGPLEEQRLPPGSVDVLVLMDVLEHVPDPLATLTAAAPALADDALLLIQTPHFDPAVTYAQLLERKDPFLVQLKSREHLFLLSEGSAGELLSRAGFGHVLFEPAIFSIYDMFLVASRKPIPTVDAWRDALRRTRNGRMMEALIDAYDAAEAARKEERRLASFVDGLERDRAARLDAIHERDRRIEEIERDRAAELERHEAELKRQAAELERLWAVERTHQEVLRRLGPLKRLFDAGSRPPARKGDPR